MRIARSGRRSPAPWRRGAAGSRHPRPGPAGHERARRAPRPQGVPRGDVRPGHDLSAKSDVETKVTGLRLGATDFMAKPFAMAGGPRPLRGVLRIESLHEQLRRAQRPGGALRHRRADRPQEPAASTSGCTRSSAARAVRRSRVAHHDRRRSLQDRERPVRPPDGRAPCCARRRPSYASIRDDICCGYGGEEFAIMLEDPAGDGARGRRADPGARWGAKSTRSRRPRQAARRSV